MGTSSDQYVFWIISCSFILWNRNVAGIIVEKIKTHILCTVTLFRKSYHWWDNMEKVSRAGESTDGNIKHQHFTLHMKGYKHPLTEYEIVVAFILQQSPQEYASMYVIVYGPFCLRVVYSLRHWNWISQVQAYII
jgi:hypothetical protein